MRNEKVSAANRTIVHGLLQTVRGMCVDEDSYAQIDAVVARAVDRAKDVEAERDRYREAAERILAAFDRNLPDVGATERLDALDQLREALNGDTE